MDIYTVKEGENISTIQATKLVIHMLRDLIFICIYHPDLHINGKYIFSCKEGTMSSNIIII